MAHAKFSSQLAQDDDGFEIRSIADSLSDDEEQARKDIDRSVPPSGGASTSLADAISTEPNRPQASNSLPQNTSKAPQPPPQSTRPRESLDGETIFAVGDDGIEWSEGEDESDDETRKLNRKDAK